MRLTNAAHVTRAFAVVSLGLIAYAQIQAPAGSEALPSALVGRFVFFPAGWSLTIFLAVALAMRDRLALAATLAVAAGFGALLGRLSGAPGDVLRDAMIGFGLAPYLFALAGIARRKGAEREAWIDMLALGSIIHITALAIPYFRDQTTVELPHVVDGYVAMLDEGFGFQVSSGVAQLLEWLPQLRSAAFAAYALVQIPIVIIAAICWRRRETRGMLALPTFMIASIIGFGCYHLAPAMGPKYYFGDENSVWHMTTRLLGDLPQIDLDPHHPRNSMPSLHFTWAFLVFLFSRGLPVWGRALAGTFAFLTFCATLGLREHYFVDLVVAMSLVLLVRSLCAIELGFAAPERVWGVALGGGMLAYWLALIPFAAQIYPPMIAVLSVLTVAVSLLFENQLARAEIRVRRGVSELQPELAGNAAIA